MKEIFNRLNKEFFIDETDKFINVPLLKKGRDVLNEILDVCELIEKHDASILGGFARYCASESTTSNQVSDIDIFFKSQLQFNQFIGDFYKFKNVKFNKYYKNTRYNKTYESGNSITFEINVDNIAVKCLQLIKPIDDNKILTVGEPEKIMSRFDFSITKAWIDKSFQHVRIDKNLLNDDLHKKIRVLKIESPITALLRIQKYAKKGYHASPVEILNILKDWDSKNSEYKEKMYNIVSETKEEHSNESFEMNKYILENCIDENISQKI